MKTFVLFLLTAVLSFAEVTTRIVVDGSTLPATVLGIPWVRLTNYGGASGNPNQGIGISYRGDAIKMDVYVYDSLNSDWAQLPLRERIERENESIPSVFEQMVERGAYSDVKLKPRKTVVFGDREFDHTELDYTDKDAGELNSHYYLSELNGKILKIRISRNIKSEPSLAREAFEEIATSLLAGDVPSVRTSVAVR